MMYAGVSRQELRRQASQVAPPLPFIGRLSDAVSYRRDSASEQPNSPAAASMAEVNFLTFIASELLIKDGSRQSCF